jgi:type I restriction enzyme M protein
MMDMKELVKHIQSFSYHNGKGTKQVMSDLLKFIIFNFNPEPKPDPTWSYTKEQNREFHEMMIEYFALMKDKLEKSAWYDAWGDLFMELTPKGGSRGQFFTPVDICNLMAGGFVNTDTEPTSFCGAFGKRVTISDPAAGSARNLLACHTKFLLDKKRKPYLIAEDVDLDCCRMSAVNMLVHGCFGEVVCHNTLTDPKGLLFGYIINEGIYPLVPGLPTIRVSNNPSDFFSLR